MGSANAAAAVKVNDTAAYRKDGHFWSEFQVDNSQGPVSAALTTFATLPHGANPDISSTSTIHRFVPQSGVTFTHEPCGDVDPSPDYENVLTD